MGSKICSLLSKKLEEGDDNSVQIQELSQQLRQFQNHNQEVGIQVRESLDRLEIRMNFLLQSRKNDDAWEQI